MTSRRKPRTRVRTQLFLRPPKDVGQKGADASGCSKFPAGAFLLFKISLPNKIMKFGCDDCNNCGACCRELHIELSKEDIRKLVELGYVPDDFLELKPIPRTKLVGKEKNCVFLNDEIMCTIEKNHGHESKPHGCILYPRFNPDEMNKNDYFFYEYGGKTLTRDILIKMLGRLRKTSRAFLFEMLLDELETIRKQDNRYVDIFNYDDEKRGSDLGKRLARRRISKMLPKKFRDEDSEEFGKIKKAKEFDVRMFMNEICKGVPGKDALNPNMPDMLLAFFRMLRDEEPREAKALAEYFFEWNGKRFLTCPPKVFKHEKHYDYTSG